MKIAIPNNRLKGRGKGRQGRKEEGGGGRQGRGRAGEGKGGGWRGKAEEKGSDSLRLAVEEQ